MLQEWFRNIISAVPLTRAKTDTHKMYVVQRTYLSTRSLFFTCS